VPRMVNPKKRLLLMWLSAAWAGAATAANAPGAVGSVVVEPVGFANYPIPSRAIELAYFLPQDGALALNYSRGSTDLLLANYRVDLLLLRYNYPIGALTHIKLGGGARSLNYQYKVRSGAEETAATASSTTLVTEASFGNQVSIGPVIFGCDWLGFVVPLLKIASKSHFPDDTDDSERRDDEGALAAATFSTTMQFMRVFIGVTF